MQYFGFDKTVGQMRNFGFGDVSPEPEPNAPLIPVDYVLRYDFDGDVLDSSANGLHGIQTGTVAFAAGRKAGTQCITFANGCVKTNGIVPVDSDKVTLSFWLKTTQSEFGLVMESSTNADSLNAFNVLVYNYGSDNLVVANQKTNYNTEKVNNVCDGAWRQFITVIDRAETAENECRIYCNNVSEPTVRVQNGNNGKFTDAILYIGQRAANEFKFSGSIQDLRVYNRVLTAAERTALFDE